MTASRRPGARLPRVALIAALALGVPQARAGEPATSVEVPADRRAALPLDGAVDYEVLDAWGLEITRIDAQTLGVESGREGGTALLLLWDADGTARALTVTALRPPDDKRSQAASQPAGAPSLWAAGEYRVWGTTGSPIAHLLHSAGWSQEMGDTRAAVEASVERTPVDTWALRGARAEVSRPTWSVVLGDTSASADGPTEMGIPIRGGRADFRPVEALDLSVTAGVGQSPWSFDYFLPERLVLATAAARYRFGDRVEVSASGGVMHRPETGRTDPLVGARVVARYGIGSASVFGTIAGPGGVVGALATAGGSRWRVAATFDHQTNDFQYPLDIGVRTQGRTAARGSAYWEFVPGLRLQARSQWRRQPAYQDFVGSEGLQVAPGLTWRGEDRVRVWGEYLLQRTVTGLSPAPRVGHGAVVGSSWAPTANSALAASVSGQFAGERVSAFAGLQGSWAPREWRLSAGYFLQALFGGQGVGHWADLRARLDRETWSTQVGARVSARAKSPVAPFLDLAFGWRPLSGVQVDLSIGSNVPVGGAPWSWTTQAFWRVDPHLWGKPGTLGLRGRVAGAAFLDLDRDGLHDEDEDGLPGMAVLLDGVPVAETDDEGMFLLRGLRVGEHLVELDRGEYRSLQPDRRSVDVIAAGRRTEAFPLGWGARVEVRLFVDLDRDGAFDDGEGSVEAEYVLLRASDGQVLRTGETLDGRVIFSGLPQDEYTVIVDEYGLPPGYAPLADLEQVVFVGEGEAADAQVPFWASRTISGVVWQDVDGDGEGGGRTDLGLGGVDVTLSSGVTVRTGPDGIYRFEDLPPGAYSVQTPMGDAPKLVVLGVGPTDALGVDFVVSSRQVAQSGEGAVSGFKIVVPLPVVPPGLEFDARASFAVDGGSRDATAVAAWTSSNPAVLSVVGPGRLRATGSGAASITATLGAVSSRPVEVRVLGEDFQVDLYGGALSLRPGGTHALRATASDSQGYSGDVTSIASWGATDPTIAVFDRPGELRAARDGVTTVFAQVAGRKSDEIEVTVMTPPVTVLRVEGLPSRMPEGASVRLHALGYEQDLSVGDFSTQVEWESSDPTVLSIDAEGNARALRGGIVRVTARLATVTAPPRTVTVTNQPPDRVRVTPETLTMGLTERPKLSARATFETGMGEDVTGVVTWEVVEGTSVAIEEDGTLLPLLPGISRVRAIYLGVASEPVTIVVSP